MAVLFSHRVRSKHDSYSYPTDTRIKTNHGSSFPTTGRKVIYFTFLIKQLFSPHRCALRLYFHLFFLNSISLYEKVWSYKRCFFLKMIYRYCFCTDLIENENFFPHTTFSPGFTGQNEVLIGHLGKSLEWINQPQMVIR